MNKLLANYHTHTFRCGHARGEDREYIENAIKCGLKILGFSDHSPMPFPDGRKSGHRIQLDMAEDYFTSLTDLKKEYKDDIEIHIGVETEYYPDIFDRYCEYMSAFPCEYMILGQHFINDEREENLSFKASDDDERLRKYFRNVADGVKTGKFLYVAHPDVINYTGSAETFKEESEKFLNEIKPYNIPVEINRLGLEDGRHYPRKAFFDIVRKTGNPVIIGIDAHNPEALSDKRVHNRCFEFAGKAGIESIKDNILNIQEKL